MEDDLAATPISDMMRGVDDGTATATGEAMRWKGPVDWKAHSDAVIAERFDRAFPMTKNERDYLAERVLLAILPSVDVLREIAELNDRITGAFVREASGFQPSPQFSSEAIMENKIAEFCYRMAGAMAKASKS